jgi:KTSC domain
MRKSPVRRRGFHLGDRRYDVRLLDGKLFAGDNVRVLTEDSLGRLPEDVRGGTWYHYCEIDPGTVSSLLAAESMGRLYNASIKGNFDCRTHRVPAY